MDIRGKNVLVLGLGISGVSTAKALYKLGANIIISDLKKEEELIDYVSEIRDLNVRFFLGTNDVPLEYIDLIIKSPGIPLTVDLIKEANRRGIEVISDIELAYRINPDNNFIAITGTNGKTTTTALTGEFFKNGDLPTHVVGNIGVGILWNIVNSDNEDIFVIEASSFQLESTVYFNPKVSVILNITPDHLDWHKDLEAYIDAKKKIFRNQTKDEYTILNYDDKLLRNMEKEVASNLIWFSRQYELPKGVYVKDGYIVINDGNSVKALIKTDEIKLLGKHNLENVLASVSIAWIMGLDMDTMKYVLKTFSGVEHRIEYVDTVNGIKFYNDSKGTNPDASIKAIEALKSPIILIAGGHDKGNEFDEFILSFNNKVKALILLGETKYKIKNTAIKYGFNNIYIVDNMKEAVIKSYELAKTGDNVLLSPACASWDMYRSFEERGKDFKKAVHSLREE
ncbi:MAG: UDP-N-acetylmuramoyl-L-alanine--D-glutamate ligase [Tissierellia bacterium]|nr:UDP-N-acetylmuramoyl-L-alanine--D-glutamate ligase [Tissierellia bacterium]